MGQMLHFTSEKTYSVLRYIINNKRFKQIEIQKATKVSAGRVNEIVQWLKEKGLVRKIKGCYEILSVADLISKLGLYITINKRTLNVKADRKKLLKWLAKHKAIFCNTSALQFYSSYFRDPSVNVYYSDLIYNELNKFPKGNLRITFYNVDLKLLKGDTIKNKGLALTSELRTAIELFADNKAYVAEPLIDKLVRK